MNGIDNSNARILEAVTSLRVPPVERREAAALVLQRIVHRESQLDREIFDPNAVINRSVDDRLRPIREANKPSERITQFIMKTVTDCNLRCTYCYEYVDDAWRLQPKTMDEYVAMLTARRIGQYAAATGLKQLSVIFHGGEPLLMPDAAGYYDKMIPQIQSVIRKEAGSIGVSFGMQTNAALLRPEILDVLRKYDIGLGVSLDGPAAVHDMYRVTKHGKHGSHDMVLRGLKHLAELKYSGMLRGILSVVNIDSDPLEVDAFLSAPVEGLRVPSIDYLLPYATHDNPPHQPRRKSPAAAPPYADWLLQIFRLRQPDAPPVRLFQSMLQLCFGGKSSTEAIGPDAGSEVTIRTDGSIEFVDALRVANSDAVRTNMHVETHSFMQVAEVLRANGHLGRKSVADACVKCPLLRYCGGGHIATRYSTARGFNNASVYCRDLSAMVTEVNIVGMRHMRHAVEEILEKHGVLHRPVEGHFCTDC